MFFHSFEGYEPGARFNDTPWIAARIEEATSSNGPWTILETVSLTPLDTDPENPAVRNFSTSLATLEAGWYRITFVDSAGAVQSAPPRYSSAVAWGANGTSLLTLRERVKKYGFSESDAEVDATINDRYKEMVARSEWLLAPVALGDTVAEQRSYPIDQDVAAIKAVTVAGTVYQRSSVQDMMMLASGAWTGESIYGESYTADGQFQIDLHPTPDEAGQAVVVLAALLPADLVGDAQPIIPADFHEYLIDGATSTLSKRIDNRLADAAALEQRFERGIELLRQRRMRRAQSGPIQIPIKGYQW